MERRIVFATGNENKMSEIRMILSDLGMPVYSMKELGVEADIVEDGISFEENAEIVKMCVAFCHSIGVTVEGLVGRMPNVDMVEKAEGNLELKEFFTDPDEIEKFIEITGADALTVSFGTVHGMTVAKPVLDMEHLRRLRKASDCALVMHGSSGVAPEQMKEAITYGLSKVNVYTKVSTSAQKAIMEAVDAERPLYYHEIEAIAKKAMKESAKETIRLLSNGYIFR